MTFVDIGTTRITVPCTRAGKIWGRDRAPYPLKMSGALRTLGCRVEWDLRAYRRAGTLLEQTGDPRSQMCDGGRARLQEKAA